MVKFFGTSAARTFSLLVDTHRWTVAAIELRRDAEGCWQIGVGVLCLLLTYTTGPRA